MAEGLRDEMDADQSAEGKAALEVNEPPVLTERDVAVFRFIHEQRYVVYNQIKRAFWPDCSKDAKACYRRVMRLVNAGYLALRYSPKKRINVYLLAERGWEELKGKALDHDLKLYEPSDHFDRCIDHDLKVITVRIIFRELGLRNWTSERMLKERSSLKRYPDGILNAYGDKISIELENYITKGKKRYVELFDYYGRNPDYRFVFMILDGDTKDWLIDLDYNAQQVWFATYRELLWRREETMFENKRDRFTLARIL